MDERIIEIILKYNYAELEQLIKDLQLFTTVKLAIDTHSDKMKELNDAASDFGFATGNMVMELGQVFGKTNARKPSDYLEELRILSGFKEYAPLSNAIASFRPDSI
jgi:hypothetical protein